MRTEHVKKHVKRSRIHARTVNEDVDAASDVLLEDLDAGAVASDASLWEPLDDSSESTGDTDLWLREHHLGRDEFGDS